MSHWWRAYDGSIDHPKLLKLSDRMHRAWYTLQCIASANGGVLPPADDIATRLREKPAKVAEWITHLVGAKLIDNEGGLFRPHNWDDRQFLSDSSTSRVQKHRNKKRNVSSTVTRNVSVTSNETAPEAEAYSEADSEQSRADASAPIDEDLKRKASALAAGISAHFLSRQQGIPNLDRCLLWLTQGYAAGTVLGAVEAVLKRGKQISTLEYFDGAIRDAHAKVPAPVAGLEVVSSRIFVEVGTLEWTCWTQHHRDTGKLPPQPRDTRIDDVIKTGWWFESQFPPGYDEATGERLAPQSEENAA